MARVSLRKLLKLQYIRQVDVDTFIGALNYAKSIKAIRQDQNLMTAIDAAILSLETYKTIIDVYNQILALIPVVDKAVSIGAAALNPAEIPKMAQVVAIEIANQALEKAAELPKMAMDAILDYEIEV